MPTQEERLTALEQNFAAFQKETAQHLREIDENTIIMLGRIRNQGQDIRGIFQHLEKIDERLNTMDERLSAVDGRLSAVGERLNRLETKVDEQTVLLTQILARLPETH